MVELAADRGYENVTVRGLSRLAGVSTRSFYDHFSNIDDCFATTYEAVASRVTRRIVDAKTAGDGEADRGSELRARIEVLMREFAAQPKSAWVLLVEPYRAGSRTRAMIGRAECRLERALLAGRPDPPPRQAASVHSTRGVVAGVARVARTRLMSGRAEELPSLAPELAAWVLSLRCRPAEPSTDSRSALARSRPREPTAVPALGPVGDEAARVLTATARIAVTGGFASLNVPTILREAGVSRRGFEKRFRGIPECFREAVESLTRTAVGWRIREALATGTGPPLARVTAAVCLELARNPALARLLFVEVPEAGRAGLRTREELISEATSWVLHLTPDPSRVNQAQTEASIAAAWHVLDAEIARGGSRRLVALAPVATSLATALSQSGT